MANDTAHDAGDSSGHPYPGGPAQSAGGGQDSSRLEGRSLLVKARPARGRPFLLEDLTTGRRREFDSLSCLLDSIVEALQPDSPRTRSERCE